MSNLHLVEIKKLKIPLPDLQTQNLVFNEIKKQKDTWVFTKNLSDKNPIWFLKSTL